MIHRAEVRWTLSTHSRLNRILGLREFITNMSSAQTEDKTTAGMCWSNLQLSCGSTTMRTCVIMWCKWDCRYPTSSKMSYLENVNSSTGIVKAFLKAELNPLNI